jgi:RIO kinase 1
VPTTAARRPASRSARDCENVCRWFAARGLSGVDVELLFGDLMAEAVGNW